MWVTLNHCVYLRMTLRRLCLYVGDSLNHCVYLRITLSRLCLYVGDSESLCLYVGDSLNHCVYLRMTLRRLCLYVGDSLNHCVYLRMTLRRLCLYVGDSLNHCVYLRMTLRRLCLYVGDSLNHCVYLRMTLKVLLFTCRYCMSSLCSPVVNRCHGCSLSLVMGSTLNPTLLIVNEKWLMNILPSTVFKRLLLAQTIQFWSLMFTHSELPFVVLKVFC